MSKEQQPEKFFWLVSGEVFFHPEKKPAEVQSSMVSVTIRTDGPSVNADALVDAQRGLMQSIINRTADSKVRMVSVQVTIVSVSGLGLMTEEEFFGKSKVN